MTHEDFYKMVNEIKIGALKDIEHLQLENTEDTLNTTGGKKICISKVSTRDLYAELRTMGLSHDSCDQVLKWSETLRGK